MKRLLTSLLLIIITFNVFSRSGLDSLEITLKKTSSDTAKIIIMLNLADNLFFDDVTKSHEYFYKAKKLLKTVTFKNGTAYYYYINGLMNPNTPTMALESYNKSLRLYCELKDRQGIAAVSLALGAMYVDQSKENKGMPCYLTALRIFQSLND